MLREGNSLQKHRACIHSTLKEGGSRKKTSQILIEGMLIGRDIPKEKSR